MTPEQKSALESAIAHFERNGFWEAAELRGILDEEARRTVPDGMSGQEAQPIYQVISRGVCQDVTKEQYDACEGKRYERRIVNSAPIPATEQEKP